MKNRRFGSDLILKVITSIIIISWAALFAVVISAAGIPLASGITGYLQKLKGLVSPEINKISGLIMFIAVISVSGILINLFRLKRRSDKMRLSIVLSGIISAALLILINIK